MVLLSGGRDDGTIVVESSESIPNNTEHYYASLSQPPSQDLQAVELRVLSLAIEEKNRFFMRGEEMPLVIDLAKHKEATKTAPILLRCLFDEGSFELFVDPMVVLEPERFGLVLYTTSETKKLDLDFLRSLEAGGSYEVFFNHNPLSVGGIRAFDYAKDLSDREKKEMANPATQLPKTISLPKH